MTSRMDKYQEKPTQSVKVMSRAQKNQQLYEKLYTNKVLTEFVEIENNNAFDLSDSTTVPNFSNRREAFQKSKQLFSNNTENEFTLQKPIEEEALASEEVKEKNYNINDILDTARKNRIEQGELDKRKQLKTVEYNILSDLSKEKLTEYKERKQKLSKDEEENLEELIHTITSNSLRKKIDDELLSDLLPSEESETIISNELSKEINYEYINQKAENQDSNMDTKEQKIDDSFYTKSMDLSEEDFDFSEEDESFLEDAKMGTSKKILITLFIILIIGIIGYVIYRFI